MTIASDAKSSTLCKNRYAVVHNLFDVATVERLRAICERVLVQWR